MYSNNSKLIPIKIIKEIRIVNEMPILPKPIIVNKAVNAITDPKVITVKTNPSKTATDELTLCLTVSASLLASILGYFKLTIIPKLSEINGKTNEAIKHSIISKILK